MAVSTITQPVTYLFIDGSYFRRYFYEAVLPWVGDEPGLDMKQLVSTYKAKRCFYYDCLDDIKKPSEADADFDARVQSQNEFFDSISQVDGCHVRLGSLTGTAKNKRQKQVDILLAVDMLNHAVRRNMENAVLLAGDQDFKPVIESLIQMGIMVKVAGYKKHTSKQLTLAADSYFEIGFMNCYRWTDKITQARYPLPSAHIGSIEGIPLGQKIRTGKLDYKDVSLHTAENGVEHYLIVNDFANMNPLIVKHPVISSIELYMSLHHEPVVWD